MVVQPGNAGTWRVEAGESGIQTQHWLHSESEVSLAQRDPVSKVELKIINEISSCGFLPNSWVLAAGGVRVCVGEFPAIYFLPPLSHPAHPGLLTLVALPLGHLSVPGIRPILPGSPTYCLPL